MSDNMRSLTDFERAVLHKLLDGDHPILSLLRRQLVTCQVSGREFTGHGFFTGLHVDTSTSPALATKEKLQIGGVGAEMSGLKYGAGFMVFVTDGYLDFLEAFSYEEPWPLKISDYSLMYTGERSRDPSVISQSSQSHSGEP
jgi:hypothetical protein